MATIFPPVSEVFVAICKKSFTPLVNENDECVIFNLAAIRYGLDALLKADASDYEREQQLWALAEKSIVQEQENLVGAGAQGPVQIEDTFEMACFPSGI